MKKYSLMEETMKKVVIITTMLLLAVLTIWTIVQLIDLAIINFS